MTDIKTETIQLPIHNMEGKEVDTVKLDSAVFSGSVNTAAIYQAANEYQANQRKGQASTKTRGEVSGGGRKPWKQKGTGRARVGSTRSPLWRHGGVIFGPHPRDFSFSLPQRLKSVAFKSALLDKIKAENILIVDSLAWESPKTKEAARVLSKLKVDPRKSALLLLDKIDDKMRRSLRNIGFLTVNRTQDTNTWEILSHQQLIVTRDAWGGLTDRLKKAAKHKAH